MRKRFIWSVLAVTLGVFSGWLARSGVGADEGEKKALVHVVLFELKDDAPKTAVAELVKDSHKMLAKIPVVNDLHIGRRTPASRDIHVKD